MLGMNRREYIQGMLAALTAATAPPHSNGTLAASARKVRNSEIQLAELFGPVVDSKVRLARQTGVNHAIVAVSGALSQVPRDRYVETLKKIKSDFKAAGMTIAGVESHPVPAEKIKLGFPGRDEEIENYIAAIQALSQVGIPMVCYNFMAGLGWYRTRSDVPERGGALASEFDNQVATQQGLTQWGEISEDRIWSNMEYFLKAVIPVAEKA